MLAARRSQLISRVLAAALGDCSASRPCLPQAAATQISALAGPGSQQFAAPAWSHGLQRPYSQAAPSSEAGQPPHHQAPHDQAAAAAATGAGEFEHEGSYEYADSYEYDSYEVQDDHSVEDLQHQLLQASLAHVAQLGWTQAALQAGARDVGVSPSSAGILDQGAVGLVDFFMDRCNRELEQALQQPAPADAAAGGEGAGEGAAAGAGAGTGAGSIAEHVRRGLRLRLEMNVPYINTWAQALSLQARPQAAARALQQRAEIADIIWHAAGDRSIDLTWYIKRGLLTGIYSATELYMLTDASPGFADTWAALDRQLAGWLSGSRTWS